MPVIGSPSSNKNLTAACGKAKAHVGTDGEKRTAYVLDGVFRNDPLTWVIHDIDVPGYDYANIDHLILRETTNGTHGVVVDSKLWLPGKYRITPNGLSRDGDEFKPGRSAMGLLNMKDSLLRFLGIPSSSFNMLISVWPSKVGKIDMGLMKKKMNLGNEIIMVKGANIVSAVDQSFGSLIGIRSRQSKSFDDVLQATRRLARTRS